MDKHDGLFDCEMMSVAGPPCDSHLLCFTYSCRTLPSVILTKHSDKNLLLSLRISRVETRPSGVDERRCGS